MRDEHLDSAHREAKAQAQLRPDDLDLDEIQPLLFDLVRLDKVDEVKRLLPYFHTLNFTVQSELKQLVASSGSALMAQVLISNPSTKDKFDYLVAAIRGLNLETSRWFLSLIGNLESRDYSFRLGDFDSVLAAILESDSMEIFQECEKFLIERSRVTYPKGKKRKRLGYTDPVRAFTWPNVINATARDPRREEKLLSFWTELRRRSRIAFDDPYKLGDALIDVAKTTCSLPLAKALLEHGAKIDYRRGDTYLTPLHHVARKNSPQAAELMKLFLYQGADPEIECSSSKLKRPKDEKGAKEIAKWLGMSWNELVQKIKQDREKGIFPPEYA